MKMSNELFDMLENNIKHKDYHALKINLQTVHASDIAELIHHASQAEQLVLFRLLDKDLAANVFDIMDPAAQAHLISSMSNEQASELLSILDTEDQVHLFDEMPARVVKKLLSTLPKQQKEAALTLMGYEDGTAGRIMSPVYIDVKKDMTVQQALDRIKAKGSSQEVIITTVYVTDETRKLIGLLHLSTLVMADSKKAIAALLPEEAPEWVWVTDDQEEAARLLQRIDELELPVLDKEQRLVGVLKAEEALDVLQEEITDDMYDKVGLIDISTRESDRSYNLLNKGFLHVMAVRVPFLLITLAGGMLAGAVIGAFEDLLETVVATAIFIPVIMDMGGNVGTQSSTIFTRALVLGHINMKHFFRHWVKEVTQGFGMGIILGTLGGLIAALWQGMPELGAAVGISMALTITLGIALGFLVPFFLVKLGFDQAAGSDPIITTIKDISGLAIYFACVSLFLPQVLT